MQEIIFNLKDQGIATMVIALITILVVGIFKIIPGWNKVNKEVRKAIYQAINIVMAGGMAILYHIVIANGAWDSDMLTFVVVAIGEVNILYPLYENLGIRALIRKIFSLLAPSKVKSVDQKKVEEKEEVKIKENKETKWL